MTISLLNYLTVATTLFLLGIWGLVLNRKNIIIMLMSIELMLLAINLNLITYSLHLDDIIGQAYALFILTVAAAEASIGLAIIVVYYRNAGSINIEEINNLRG